MKRGWKSLLFEDWPERERLAWEGLFRKDDVLDGCGAGAHWAQATRRTNYRQYAGWLGWLAAAGALDDSFAPKDRVTSSSVEAYVRDLMAVVSPKTVDSALRGLKVVIKAMAADQDWRWLMDMSNRIKSWARPIRDQVLPPLSAVDMFSTVLSELDRLEQCGLTKRREQLVYRDALMVGMLVAAPLRLKNLTMIEIGVHLQWHEPEWHLRFSGSEMKNRQPLHLVVPALLNQDISAYLNRVRPLLPGSNASDRLWIGQKGFPMADITIYNRVVRTSQNLFGVTINPHKFRAIAATFLAESSPDDALRARPLLGHRSFGTTEDHYIKAQQIDASNRVTSALREIRDRGRR